MDYYSSADEEQDLADWLSRRDDTLGAPSDVVDLTTAGERLGGTDDSRSA
jgi:hypothetical protein